jgi:hypothetical protein
MYSEKNKNKSKSNPQEKNSEHFPIDYVSRPGCPKE